MRSNAAFDIRLHFKMMWNGVSLLTIAVLFFVFITESHAEENSYIEALDINTARANFNYQMSCQGCHSPDGAGGVGRVGDNSVPDFNNNIGYFLRSQTGREYIVRVPGSANSALSDTDLAEVLNWILIEYAGDSLSGDWRPFEAKEILDYRKDPLFEVVEYRRQLMTELAP